MKYVQLLIPEYPTNSSLYVRTFQIRFDKVFKVGRRSQGSGSHSAISEGPFPLSVPTSSA